MLENNEYDIFIIFIQMVREKIQDWKELNTGGGKVSHTGWEGNAYWVGKK